MNIFSIMWSGFVGIFRDAKLTSLDPVVVYSAETPPLQEEEMDTAEINTPSSVAGQLTCNFHLSEFACRDGSPVPMELVGGTIELARNLQVLRDILGKPISITSGYRTPEYNRKIGGARHSKHMDGIAADIKVAGMSSAKVHARIRELIKEGVMGKGGLGSYPHFTHYDVRGTNARWSGTRTKN